MLYCYVAKYVPQMLVHTQSEIHSLLHYTQTLVHTHALNRTHTHTCTQTHTHAHRSESIRTGFLLSQGGEFAFVLLSLANKLKVLPEELNQVRQRDGLAVCICVYVRIHVCMCVRVCTHKC
jgi:Kef-type K+ transport system membrane component KefB